MNPSGVLGTFNCEHGKNLDAVRHVSYVEEGASTTVAFTINSEILLDSSVDLLRIELVAFTPIGFAGPKGSRVRVEAPLLAPGGWSVAVSFELPYKGDGFYGCQVYLGGSLVGRRAVEITHII